MNLKNKLVFSSIIFVAIILVFIFSWKREYEINFAVMPHFAIQESKIDFFYQEMVEKYNLSGKKINILIVSPNHFKNYSSTSFFENKINNQLCFQDSCYFVKSLYSSEQINKHKKYIKEHWLWVHFKYINKYFSWHDLYLSKLEWSNFYMINDILKEFKKLENKWNLLVISSVDFSHYVDENWAKFHDKKTKYVILNSLDIDDYRKIEVDCPVCIYMTNKWAKENTKYPNFIYRDSSSLIEKKNLFYNNTSRQRYFYTHEKQNENGIILWFFWDLIFDRWVKDQLNSTEKIYDKFKDWFAEWNIGNNLDIFRHRKWYWLDMLGFNLETPYVNTGCKKQIWKISFCSSGELLPFLSDIWFNFITFANNHILNASIEWYQETKQVLNQNDFGFAGYIKTKWFVENNVLEKNIRWIDLAIHAYNFFDRFKGDLDMYCQSLKKYKTEWFINIISVHRWEEYQKIHNNEQEFLWKKLIDCGADAILWHHPHIIQDIQRYKGKPIIYSLWNFLFDQYFSQETQLWMYVLMDISTSGKVEIFTGEVFE